MLYITGLDYQHMNHVRLVLNTRKIHNTFQNRVVEVTVEDFDTETIEFVKQLAKDNHGEARSYNP